MRGSLIPDWLGRYDRGIFEQIRLRRKLDGVILARLHFRRLALKFRRRIHLAPGSVATAGDAPARVTQQQLTSLKQMTSLREQMTLLREQMTLLREQMALLREQMALLCGVS